MRSGKRIKGRRKQNKKKTKIDTRKVNREKKILQFIQEFTSPATAPKT
jgi:hypothetical protein